MGTSVYELNRHAGGHWFKSSSAHLYKASDRITLGISSQQLRARPENLDRVKISTNQKYSVWAALHSARSYWHHRQSGKASFTIHDRASKHKQIHLPGEFNTRDHQWGSRHSSSASRCSAPPWRSASFSPASFWPDGCCWPAH